MMMNDSSTIVLCKRAKAASRVLAVLDDNKINIALNYIAEAIVDGADAILAANELDIAAARESISSVMIDRLTLNQSRIKAMADGIREIAALPSPLGETLDYSERPNGLKIKKVSVPFGVIAIIYESRPNVTSDAAALALKSGNAVVLRGGKEAYRTSRAIVTAIKSGLSLAGVPEDAVNLLEDTTREGARELMRANGLVDLLIPRGGAGLIRACIENATVPCLETGTGICHIYVDKDAQLDTALKIVENAKMSRPSVCNACEVCIVHSAVAEDFLPRLNDALRTAPEKLGKPTATFKLDERATKIIDGDAASDTDFDTEFLDYVLAIKTVDSVEEAVEHIAMHSTHHSEAIITQNEDAARYFTANVDSAAVYVNASTRFTDGGEFGLGCEMGISTQKMHARGPLGIKELTTYKYIIVGDGHIR